MNDGNVFQTIIIGVFVGLGVLGLVFFAVFRGDSGSDAEQIGTVRIWGTVDSNVMTKAQETLLGQLPQKFAGKISYREFEANNFNEELVEALAAGEGPDLFLMQQDDIVKHSNKIFTIPYENFTERKFKDTYVEGAEVYLDAEGVLALPFMVDPLVMYWNRDILTNGGVSVVPKYWDEFFTLSPKLTKRDQSANILQATVPFGEYRNVTNAKEIVSALIQQADDAIVVRDHRNEPEVVFGESQGNEENQPAVSALRFYTEFSNPIKSVYSWNRALEQSKQAFVAGDLAFYFGFASEITEIRKLNPNLNFDVAVLPQIRDDSTPSTFGRMLGVAILKSSPNIGGSFRIATLLSNNRVLETLNEETGLPPITRQLLNNTPTDAIQPIFYSSALISRNWLEPDSDGVDEAFANMIESVSSGRLSISRAISEAQEELTIMLK